MTCERFRERISAYVDGELEAEERARFQEHLATCGSCRRELADIAALKEELDMMTFEEPSDAALHRYWCSVYNRLERGLGWILFSFGAIVLLCYGGFKLVEEVVRDPAISWIVRAGVVGLVFGLVILFVSLARERLTVSKTDRYSREVKR
ncbi:MAG TPA: zf-HC2 domain-containing protein [Phycisphaerae bacterium]|nr:zf-HC2 domain-containing protein [Phycisphaerae bacterium]